MSEPTCLFSNIEDDFNHLYRMTRRWIIGRQSKYDNIRLAIDIGDFSDMYERVHILLSLFGDSANACKKATTVMLSFCIHAPIVSRSVNGTDEEQRLLQVINASAGYELAELMTRQAKHTTNGEEWQFSNRAIFPSFHTFLDFVRNLIRFKTAKWVNLSEEQFEVTIYQAAMILELLFYRTNPKIAGCNNAEVKDQLHAVYNQLDFNRNCDT